MSLELIDPGQLMEAWEKWSQRIVARCYEEAMSRSYMVDLEFKDKYIHLVGDSTEMIQSWQEEITPKGKVTIEPRVQRHKDFKIDLKLVPALYSRRSYLAYLAKRGSDPYDMPYLEYVLTMIMMQLIEDQELHIIWTGKEFGAIVGAHNPAQDTANGLLHWVRESVTAGEIAPPWLQGVPTLATAADEMEDFVHGVLDTPTWRKKSMYCHTSQSEIDLYQKSYRDNYGTYIHANDFGHVKVSGTNTTLIPHAGLMGNIGKILTHENNLFAGYDGKINLLVERRGRVMYILVDGEFSVNYAKASEVFVTSNLAA